MLTLFILFFVSLAGITIIIGRKFLLLKNGQIESTEGIVFDVLHPENIRVVVVKGAKKYGYILLVTTIRLYVKSSNLLKNGYNRLTVSTVRVFDKYILRNKVQPEGKEVSKFLKMVSEYKQKVRKIKHKILEEENIK